MAADPAKRLATWSLVCAAAVIPAYLVAYAIGTLLMSLLGLEEGEMITSAGTAGWLAGSALALLLPVPQAIGLWLGVRARRQGGGGRATAGIVANALIGGWLLVNGLAGLLLS